MSLVANERDYLAAVVTSLLNNPSIEFRDFMVKVLSESDKISENTKRVIISHLENKTLEAPKDNDSRFDYSLNESIKKEFDRFIK